MAEATDLNDFIYKCNNCNAVFPSNSALKSHAIHHEQNYELHNHREYISEIKGEYLIYVIKIARRIDVAIFYYIGRSKSPRNRLKQHAQPNKNEVQQISMPLANTSGMQKQDYHFIEIVDTEWVDTKSEAKNREREKFIEIAQKTGKTNILGGR